VFDGSVRENLTYAVGEDVATETLDAAIKHAKCEFIYDFQDGLDTEIGERGIRLSG
jgi:ABC-type multidrug transport system fused ATPase/permease subunit